MKILIAIMCSVALFASGRGAVNPPSTEDLLGRHVAKLGSALSAYSLAVKKRGDQVAASSEVANALRGWKDTYQRLVKQRLQEDPSRNWQEFYRQVAGVRFTLGLNELDEKYLTRFGDDKAIREDWLFVRDFIDYANSLRFEGGAAANLGNAPSAASLAQVRGELKSLTSIEGSAVGYAGIPGRFFLLYPYCVTYGDENTFSDFLKDENPVVAAMGALCILDRYPQRKEEILLRMSFDGRLLEVFPAGCVGTTMTMKTLFEKIAADPDYIVAMRFRKKPSLP